VRTANRWNVRLQAAQANITAVSETSGGAEAGPRMSGGGGGGGRKGGRVKGLTRHAAICSLIPVFQETM